MATAIRPDRRADSRGEQPERRGVPGWLTRHPVVSFFLLTYLISWSLWGVAAVGGGRTAFLLGGLGPLAAAIVVTRLTGRSVRGWLRSLLVWRVSPAYYAVALLLPVAIYAVIDTILVALGGRPDVKQLLVSGPSYVGTFFLVATVGGGLEEPGWRGFALPRLEARRSPVLSTLVIGLAWGLWHTPINGPAAFVVPLILAFFYTWLYNRTGSILLCLLLHAGFTPAQSLLTLAVTPATVGRGAGFDSTDLVILAVYVATAAALTIATRGRLGLPRPRTESPGTPQVARAGLRSASRSPMVKP